MYNETIAVLRRPITPQQLDLLSRADFYTEIWGRDTGAVEITTSVLLPQLSVTRVTKTFDPYPICYRTKPKVKTEIIPNITTENVLRTMNKWVHDSYYFQFGGWVNDKKERRVIYLFAKA